MDGCLLQSFNGTGKLIIISPDLSKGISTMTLTPEQFIKARRALGLAQAELAKKLDVTPRAVYYWEIGQRPISWMLVLAMKWLKHLQPK